MARTNDENMTKAVTEVVDLERRKSEAEMRRDIAAVDNVVANDYIQVFGSGEPGNKQTLLGMLRSPDFILHGLDSELEETRAYSNVVILLDRTTIRATFQGQDVSGQFRFIRVYANHDNKWQCVVVQASPME